MEEHSNYWPEYKICKCPLDSWEDIVVSGDENYDDRTTVYHHCDACGEDYAVLDYETNEILYLYPLLSKMR
jgi:hypothetical protein